MREWAFVGLCLGLAKALLGGLVGHVRVIGHILFPVFTHPLPVSAPIWLLLVEGPLRVTDPTSSDSSIIS